MGMDVFGNKPTAPSGEYFRNSVWYWSPLWQYCMVVAPELCEEVSGFTNEGDGLDAHTAAELADKLQQTIDSGECALYKQARDQYIANLERPECVYCHGTGVRTDEIGVTMGMPERELDEHVAIIVGRTHGWCNGCHGAGDCDPNAAYYRFELGNVAEFVAFLRTSGGFRIL